MNDRTNNRENPPTQSKIFGLIGLTSAAISWEPFYSTLSLEELRLSEEITNMSPALTQKANPSLTSYVQYIQSALMYSKI
jgi:hypothetical protein